MPVPSERLGREGEFRSGTDWCQQVHEAAGRGALAASDREVGEDGARHLMSWSRR